MTQAKNLTRTESLIEESVRREVLGQRGFVVWLTGLSGSGKSTIAYALEQRLVEAGRTAFVLDGDNVRHGLCADLGFSPQDRAENIRRVGQVAALFADAGVIAISAFISPYREGRLANRSVAGAERFAEVYLDVSVDVCEKRDPKGLYVKARAGEIASFTGISAPYEKPESPNIAIDTNSLSAEQCVDEIVNHLREREVVQP